MADQTGGEEVLRGDAAPRRTPKTVGEDPSNTPIDEITEDLDDEPGLARLAEIWADPNAAEDTVRESVSAAGTQAAGYQDSTEAKGQ